MGLRLGKGTLTKLTAVAGLAAAALVTDRLTHLPSSAPILADRTWKVPVGHELILTGPQVGDLLRIETAAGDGIKLEAGPVTLPGRSGRSGNLTWVVSRPESGEPGDNKVNLSIALERIDPTAALILQRAGAETQPELLIGSANAALRVSAGVVFGDMRVLPPTAVLLDGKRLDDPGIAFEFELAPGGDMSLTFPTFADGTPKGMTIAVGTTERRGPRLWLREVAMRSEGAGRPRRSACSAAADEHLWPALFRASSVPSGSDCDGDRRLALTALDIERDTISVDLAGTAYLSDADQPRMARWWSWVSNNPVLGAFMGLMFAALAGWAWRVISDRRS